jgi:hypothetical protein
VGPLRGGMVDVAMVPAFFDTWTSSLAKAPIRMHVAVRALGTPPEP